MITHTVKFPTNDTVPLYQFVRKLEKLGYVEESPRENSWHFTRLEHSNLCLRDCVIDFTYKTVTFSHDHGTELDKDQNTFATSQLLKHLETKKQPTGR